MAFGPTLCFRFFVLPWVFILYSIPDSRVCVVSRRRFPNGFSTFCQARELVDLATIGDQEINNDQVLYVVKREGNILR